MQLKNIGVKNFRLLHDAGLILERQTTVIVGRNNSGKASLTEVIGVDPINHKCVQRLMQKMGLRALTRARKRSLYGPGMSADGNPIS